MRHLLAIFIVCFAAAVPALGALEQSLSWEECIRQAQKENSELQGARSALRASEAQAGAARSGFFPQISAGASASQSYLGTFQPATGLSLSASQNVFNGLSDYGKARQAEATARGSQAALRSTAAKVSFDLKSAFSGLQYSQQFLQLARDIVRRRQENLRLVELRFEGGRENKGSLLFTKAVLGQARLEMSQADHGLVTARLTLASVLGLDGGADGEKLQVTGRIPETEPPVRPDFKELATSTPDHLHAVADEDAATEAISVARSGFYPALNLSASTGRQGTVFLPDQDRWSVGATLSFPLFSGFKDMYGSRSAGAALSSAHHALDATNQQLLTKLQQAHSAWLEATEKEHVDKDFLEAATVRAEIARNKYNNGLLSFEDWDVIENDLITRQKSALRSSRDRLVAEATWEQVLGKGVIAE